MTLYLYLFAATGLQALTIWMTRTEVASVVVALPLTLVFSMLFMHVFANAPSFTSMWMTATVLVNLSAILLGWLAFGERVSGTGMLGIAMIVTGILLVRTN